MSKYIYLRFKDGSKWRLPLEFVARNRAEYYAQKDFERGHVLDLQQAIASEIEWVMQDDFEAIDWMGNSMNWSDIQPHLEQVNPPSPTLYKDEFPNMENWIDE